MQIENEHDKAIAYHDTVAPKMEEKSSKKGLLFIRYNKERSIYFFYWLFKFARSVVVKSRSAFLFPDLHKQKTDRHERLFTSVCFCHNRLYSPTLSSITQYSKLYLLHCHFKSKIFFTLLPLKD